MTNPTHYTPDQLRNAIVAAESMEAGSALDIRLAQILSGWIDEEGESSANMERLGGWVCTRPGSLSYSFTEKPYDLTAAMGLVPDGWHLYVRKNQLRLWHEKEKVTVWDLPLSHALTLAALRAQLSLLESNQ